MRDEDGVRVDERAPERLGHPAIERADLATKHRISDQPRAGELDQRGGVAKESDAAPAGRDVARLGG